MWRFRWLHWGGIWDRFREIRVHENRAVREKERRSQVRSIVRGGHEDEEDEFAEEEEARH